MSINVTTEIRLEGDIDPAGSRVCDFATVEARQGKPIHRDQPTGYVRIDADVEITGTAARIRQLAKVLEDGATEMERLDAEARCKEADAKHYAALAAESEWACPDCAAAGSTCLSCAAEPLAEQVGGAF